MAETRKGEVTMKGNPFELVGPRLKAGDPAPDFTCVGAGLSVVTGKEAAGKPRIFSVVPSLDTPVCCIQTKRFADTLTSLGDKVAAYTVSTDLPFAQARFCGDAKITNMVNLSDAHDHSFGEHLRRPDPGPAHPPAGPRDLRRRRQGHDPVRRDRPRDRHRAELRRRHDRPEGRRRRLSLIPSRPRHAV